MMLALPPIHFLALAVFIACLWYFEIGARVLAWPFNTAGALPILLGLYLLIAARREFTRVRTTVMTFDAPQHLVTGGVFAWSRNPMYLGFVLVLLGGAMLAGYPAAFVAPVVFVLLARFWYIPFEEKAAAQVFGEQYDAYRAATRRWF